MPRKTLDPDVNQGKRKRKSKLREAVGSALDDKVKKRGNTIFDKSSYEKLYEQYMDDILTGKIPACKYVIQAVKRHKKDLEKYQDETRLYYFDPFFGTKICKFISLLTHVKGDLGGQRIVLEAWQCYNLFAIFGWRRRKDGGRRFRRVYIEVPRGNAKSTLSSGVALYCLLEDGEFGADVYSFATTHDQAKIVFNDAHAMCEHNKALLQHYGIDVGKYALYVPKTNSTFQPKSADASTHDGLNIHFACIDELHAHKTRDLYDVIVTGIGKRENSMLWAITTAGVNISGICYSSHKWVEKVLAGTVEDETQYGIIYTIDEGDDWTTEEAARKANPNWGVSVKADVIMPLVQQAKEDPSNQNNIKTKHFDIWCNASAGWLDMEKWKLCYDPDMDLIDFEGQPCYIGLDLSSKNDITAKVRVFPRLGEDGKEHYYIFPVFYLPRDAVLSSRNAQYDGWETLGLLTVTEGGIVDYERIQEDLIDDAHRFDVRAVAYDPWNAVQLVMALSKAGLPMVEFRQGFSKYSDPMKTFEAKVADKGIHHPGNHAFDWQMSNVIAIRDRNDNIRPGKERKEDKIDGAAAAIMGLGVSLSFEGDHGPNFSWGSNQPAQAFSW